jgi:hypothetical protein
VGRVLGFVLVVVLLVGAGFGAWTWWEKRQADAALDALPALTKDDATRAYLNGDGKVVQDMFDATPKIVADTDTCAERVKRVLPPLGNPNELSAAAAGVPDPTARDVALAHVGMLTDYAASCKGDEATTERVGEQLQTNRATFEELMAGAEQ